MQAILSEFFLYFSTSFFTWDSCKKTSLLLMLEVDTNLVIHQYLSVVKHNGVVLCRGEFIMFDDLDMMKGAQSALA